MNQREAVNSIEFNKFMKEIGWKTSIFWVDYLDSIGIYDKEFMRIWLDAPVGIDRDYVYDYGRIKELIEAHPLYSLYRI